MAKTNKLKDSNESDESAAKEKKSSTLKLPKLAESFKDERFGKIIGLLLILSSIFLLIAFTSFLFSWKIDQDKISSATEGIFFNPEITVDNWLGKIGALISYKLMHRGFGLGSYAFVLILFVFGFKFLTKYSILPIKKMLAYSILAITWLAVTLSFCFNNLDINLGGTFGFQINIWLKNFMGTIGTGMLIGFTALAYFVFAFNPSFTFLTKSPTINLDEDDLDEITAEDDLKANILRSKELEEEDLGDDSDLEGIELQEKKNDLIEEEDINEPEELEIETPVVIPSVSKGDFELDVETTDDKDDKLSDDEVNETTEKQMVDYDPTLDLSNYKPPKIDLLINYEEKWGTSEVTQEELESNKNKIIDTLKNYNIDIAKIKATIGPTITLYEIIPAPGVRVSKIKNLEDDIALSLAALGIRIIAPIPGKGTIGIEVPNAKPDVVSMKTCIGSQKFQSLKAELPIVIGKTITNETFTFDLAKAPHLLVAGATGQGKSVGLNAILTSLLYKMHPSRLKFVMVDPKMVEFSIYQKINKHFLAKLPDAEEAILTESKKVISTLNSLVIEMENRLVLCKQANARNIIEYNKKFIERKLNPNNGHKFLPYIVVVIDEFADFIMEAGKEIETPIARLAQKARAIGIHLIIATQRPSATVITGIIKANFPTRIAFRVSSAIDSRVILDTGGANQLIGKGDMLYSAGQELVRIQCALIETEEVEAIVNWIGNQKGYPEVFELPEYIDENAQAAETFDPNEKDLIFDDAARMVVETQSGSTSMIQRKFKLGYNRAGRIMDQLESAGVVGAANGSKPRDVIMSSDSLEQFLNNQ